MALFLAAVATYLQRTDLEVIVSPVNIQSIAIQPRLLFVTSSNVSLDVMEHHTGGHQTRIGVL